MTRPPQSLPLYILLTACVIRVGLTRRIDPRDLLEVEAAIKEMRKTLDLAQAAVDEERSKRRKGDKKRD